MYHWRAGQTEPGSSRFYSRISDRQIMTSSLIVNFQVLFCRVCIAFVALVAAGCCSAGGAAPETKTVTTGIASWQDGPESCPAGSHQVDIRTGDELAAATRVAPPYGSLPEGACFFLHNGTYSG